jgi:putative ABC transport system permease protein
VSASATLAPAVRQGVASVNPQLPVSGLSTMDAIVAQSVAPKRFTTLLLSLLGAAGLVLAAAGARGVTSCFVTQRSHELGV